jgi:hypothetical protein
MDDELAELRDKVTRLEGEVAMLRDIVKSYFSSGHRSSGLDRLPTIIPKAKLTWKAWLLIIAVQFFGGLLKWVPIDLFMN